ncbi:unnamed protein product [Lampetra planeri]
MHQRLCQVLALCPQKRKKGDTGGERETAETPASLATTNVPDPGAQTPGPRPRGPDPGAQTPGPRPRGPDPGAQTPGPRPRGPDPGAQTPGPRPRGPDPGAQTPGPRPRGPDPGGCPPGPSSPSGEAALHPARDAAVRDDASTNRVAYTYTS